MAAAVAKQENKEQFWRRYGGPTDWTMFHLYFP